MTSSFRALTHGAVAVAALGIAFGACAQSSQTSLAKEIGDAGPQAGKSFIDLSVGKAAYHTSCGDVAGLTCSRGTTSYSLTAGNMITDNIGVELSAMNFGKADAAGGSVSARGLNLSAVGRLPLGENFGIEGKVGPTYGVTHVTAATEAGLVNGRATGLGLGYVGKRSLPFSQFSAPTLQVDASASVRWGPLKLGMSITNLTNQEFPLSEFFYASNFNSRAYPTLAPAEHFTAAPPRTFLFTLELDLQRETD